MGCRGGIRTSTSFLSPHSMPMQKQEPEQGPLLCLLPRNALGFWTGEDRAETRGFRDT